MVGAIAAKKFEIVIRPAQAAAVKECAREPLPFLPSPCRSVSFAPSELGALHHFTPTACAVGSFAASRLPSRGTCATLIYKICTLKALRHRSDHQNRIHNET
jgi:hypothetical protein